jgi:hypothetical protein
MGAVDMRSLLHCVAAVTVLAASSGALAGDKSNTKGEANLARVIQGRTAGEPVNCIDPSRAYMTEVIDKTALIYRMPGGSIYVNRPNIGAKALDHDDVIYSASHSAQLCRFDAVQMVDRGGKGAGGSMSAVALGQFVPYSKIQR